VTRAGLEGQDLVALHEGVQQALGGMENTIYTLAAADAVSTAGDAATAAGTAAKTGFFNTIADALESILQFYQTKLDAAQVPYSYGWSIILLTLTIKIVTFPLTKKQVESSMAVQNLKPRLDAIKARYDGDEKRIKAETEILYEKAGVNPLAGCLPSLATIPIFIGLYRSLSNAADEGIFNSQGFYWIPSLAGPTSVAARKAGTSTDWLFPFVDGRPPIGWGEASLYLVLPTLVVIAQFWSASILKPPQDPDDEQAKTTAQIVKFLPLMVGWFSLNVPSGLSLYYFSNTVLTSAQQIFLRKLGGVQIEDVDLGPIKNLGSARRNGTPLTEDMLNEYLGKPPVLAFANGAPESSSSSPSLETTQTDEAPQKPDSAVLQRRSKRQRKVVPGEGTAEQLGEGNGTTVTVTAAAGNLEDEFPAF